MRPLPVVIKDDLIAAGDHEGWNDLTYAAAAEACGQAIDVPVITLYASVLSSPRTNEIGAIGDHAARICTPGAAKSGYTLSNTDSHRISNYKLRRQKKKKDKINCINLL